MKIRLARSAGFCFGVKRAIDTALKTAKGQAAVEMLGDIVHNEDVVRMINKAGVKTIKALTKGRNKTLLIRAHGAPLKTLRKAARAGYRIVDATCPMVKEIHKIAKESEEKGYTVVVIGDRKHDEVRGIIGQLKGKALLIDDIRRIPREKLKGIRKAAVVVQSTQNMDKVLAIVESLKARIKEVKFFNTICRPTRIKQREIKSLPLTNDLMIIIGSKTSANTRRLYEISKALNKRSHWVRTKKDIRPEWFKGVKSVGVTAGASTPDETTRQVIDCIRKLPK